MAGALRSALVVVDTNVLLNLYRYNESTRDDLLDVLTKVGDRLWVPHQVMREFWRNRLSVIAGRRQAGDQAVAALTKQRAAGVDAITQWARTAAVDAGVRDVLVRQIELAFAELVAGVQRHAPIEIDISGGAMTEPVVQALELLLHGKVGRAASDADWKAAVDEGKARISRRRPPGYLDADKHDSGLPEGPAGDYLVWQQAADEARRRGLDLLIVTGDEKEDWWWRHRSEFIGPRVELVAEFAAATERQLFMMRPTDLLRRGSALAVEVRSESVDDAERVGREETRPCWTAGGVQALLDGLEEEGLGHAEVIRAAALRGGRIGREDVYEICGFEDDRMLRGFTRPAARITRYLQEAGLVAQDVEPALTPEYAGGGIAHSFRIPAEMTAILASDGQAESGD